MAYQKKYYFSFKDLNESLHLVELWQNTESVISAEEIKGHMNPFAVEMPELDHKFQVVRGTGCQINILSETDMKFFTGLYHVNPTDFMVKHYINGVINWLGYLNAEMMTEPYDIDFNYQVSITGNDGFSLMDRFSFVQSDGTNYTGLKTKFDILQIIFAKIGLPWSELRVALSTVFVGHSANPNSNVLIESYVNCANFYDEDDKPMTLREVVESVLAPYAAFIRAEDGNIYITDVHMLASASTVTYQRRGATNFTNYGTIDVPNRATIASIGWMGTGQSIERSGGINRQVIAYSPYPIKDIQGLSVASLDEFASAGEWELYNGYYRKTLSGNKYWSGTSFEASKENLNTQVHYYMKIPNTTPPVLISEMIYKPNVIFPAVTQDTFGFVVSGLKLSILAEVLLRTKNNPYNQSQSNGTPYNFTSFLIEIKCGDKYYVGATSGTSYPEAVWQTTPGYINAFSGSPDQSPINNLWIKSGLIGDGIPILFDVAVSGELSIKIYTYGFSFGEIWLKNIIVKLTDWNGSDLPDNDVEYIGLLDKQFQNEGEKITLTCGTDSQFADRGKILKFDGTDYVDVTQWTRAGQTFKIEELLLGSVCSNYRSGFITLMNMKLKNRFKLQNVITDQFTGAALFMVKSATINYQDYMVDCSLVEITADELIIEK